MQNAKGFFIHKKFWETNGFFAFHQCEADQNCVLGIVALSAGTRCKIFETAHFFFWLSKASDHPVTIAT